MFRNHFFIITTVVASVLLLPFFVHAQILGNGTSNTTKVTVGTTTYEVRFSSAPNQAVSRVQDILYYLRKGFGFENVNSTIPSPYTASQGILSNVYNDIADIAFSTAIIDQKTGARVNTLFGSCHTFVGSFDRGDSDPEVLEIQRFLNKDPDTKVASTGVGSAGSETEFFGALTDAAVRAFQRKYASEVLNPLGLYQPTGFWGPSSRAKANTLNGCQ